LCLTVMAEPSPIGRPPSGTSDIASSTSDETAARAEGHRLEGMK
jgi:hypothetical protein